jgi:hypothetical protein
MLYVLAATPILFDTMLDRFICLFLGRDDNMLQSKKTKSFKKLSYGSGDPAVLLLDTRGAKIVPAGYPTTGLNNGPYLAVK